MSGRAEADARGSVTVLVAAVAGLVMFVGAALGVVMAMVHAHRVAQTAADLAALAGARSIAIGGDGCAGAARIAAANTARLTACGISGAVVTVEVVVSGPHWLGQSADLTGRSRAGPG